MSAARSTAWPALLAHIAREDARTNPRSIGPAVALGAMLALAWEAEVYAHHPDAVGTGLAARPADAPPHDPAEVLRELTRRLT